MKNLQHLKINAYLDHARKRNKAWAGAWAVVLLIFQLADCRTEMSLVCRAARDSNLAPGRGKRQNPVD